MGNFVELTGSLVGEPVIHELSDGTDVLQWRMRIERENAGSDTIPCTTSVSKVMRFVEKLKEGRVFSVEGQIRSRYWRSGAATLSRIEVDVLTSSKM